MAEDLTDQWLRRGNFLIDQTANQDHVGRPGPIMSPHLVGKMPDMDKVAA